MTSKNTFWPVFVFYILFSSTALTLDAPIPSLGQSIPERSKGLTIGEAFRLALEKNERVKISEEDIENARETIRLARSVVLPALSTSLAQSRNKSAGSGGFTTFRNNREFRLELDQALYGGGKEWAAMRAAKMEKEAAEMEFRQVQQAILFEVATEFFSLYQAQENLSIAEKALDLARKQLALAVARRQAGTATRTEVIRSEVVVSAAERDLVKAKKDVKVFRSRLGFVIGQPLEDQTVDIEREASLTSESKDAEKYVEKAVQSRPDYRLSELNLKIAEESVRMARAAFSPTASLSGDFSRSQHVSSFRDNDNWQIQAKVEYDLFDGFGRDASYEQAKILLRQATLEQMYLARQIDLDVRESLLEIEALESILKNSEKEVAAAQENYERVIEQFREGLSTAVEVADAHTALIVAEVQMASAGSQIKLAEQTLELSLGTIGEKYLQTTIEREADR